jgi:hypothetical protein
VFAQQYTATEIVQIINALAVSLILPVIAAVGLLISQIRATGRKVEDNTRVTVSGLADLSAKTDVVNGHVNSESARKLAQIEGLIKENMLLREVLADKKSVAALLAQTAATSSRTLLRASDPLVSDAAIARLEKIDKNTEATAQNTAHTDEAMRAIAGTK